uniref:FBD domain-containing protein n=1 Tax=Panagrolaimus sp. JU765 TaxID=591449 RepID=A0AC34Q154_9BILA
MVQFTRIDFEPYYDYYADFKFGLNSPLKNLWFNAMESLEDVTIRLTFRLVDLIAEILLKLNNLKQILIYNLATPNDLLDIVDILPTCSNLIFFNDVDDELLKLLALKSSKSNPLQVLSKSNPLQVLRFIYTNGFSVNAVEQFFEHAIFADSSFFILEIKATFLEIEEMFGRIVGYQVDSLKNDNGAITAKLKKISDKSCVQVIAVSKDS